jgi:anthraniloyl-CoA monooxygenase
MRIAVIGAGPGGLFFAVLMKRADPAHQITVFERNAADATFGFGVVFPERSMRYLREADQQTHEAFTQAMIQWDALEYRHRGRVLRCGGHVFSGIARTDLLRILQEQARGLGVDLRFECEITRLADVAGYDLVVAADGINSMVRGELADRFRPSIHMGKSKYIWLGTTQAFSALTFIFEKGTHGWFGAHIYPYGPALSTFIVETDDDTWRRAGFDRITEAVQLEYCQRLFARHLDGHRLQANNSKWLSFRTVRNRPWHAGNVVLAGDAAHTAHFSVGSGTRMALEDAIGLAHALQRHAGLADALAAYEGERRPAVRRIQRAAEPSRRWWEGFRHWTVFQPEQLAFHHLARTRVLTYGTLTVRDAQFVAGAETWFASRAGESSTDARAPLLTPLQLGAVVLPNRIVTSTTGARSEAGLILTVPFTVSHTDRVARSPDSWRIITESIHARTAAKVGLRLNVLTATGEERTDLTDTLDRTVRLGVDAGFDVLVLDGLVASRRFLDLVAAARIVWPPDRPLGVGVEAWEDPEDDDANEARLALARELKGSGCDLVAVSMPAALAARDPERAREAHAHASDLIRNLARVPTMMLGGDYAVGDVNALILAGRADLCEWPRLAWSGWRPV